MSVVLSRIEELVEAAPKSGLKASLYLGVLSSITRIVEDAQNAARMGECIGVAQQACKESGGSLMCNTGCASIVLVKEGDSIVVAKYSSGAGALIVSPSSVEVRGKEARIVIEPRSIKAYIRSGDGWKEFIIDSAAIDDLTSNSYFIKYVIRKVGRIVATIHGDLRQCARARAITC